MISLQLIRLYSLLATFYVGLLLPLFLIGFDESYFLEVLYFVLLSSLSVVNVCLIWKRNKDIEMGRLSVGLQYLLESIYFFPWPLFLDAPLDFYGYFLALPCLRHVRRVSLLLEEFPTLPPVVYRLTPIFIVAPLLVHFTSCFWIAIGSGSAGNQGDFALVYMKALYWSITTLTTVGYGDITAITPVQMAYASLIQILGVGIFGYVLSNVAGILARADAARERHMNNLDKVETYMKIHRIPTDLKRRIRTYYQYLWQSKKGYQNADLLVDLPETIQSQLLLHVNQSIIKKVPFLKGADEELLAAMMSGLQSRILIPGETIFQIGDPGDEIYFIQSGEVEILGQELVHIATLTDGSFFGEMALISERTRSATAVARSFCDVYSLSRQSFEKIAQEHPTLRTHIEETMDRRQSRD